MDLEIPKEFIEINIESFFIFLITMPLTLVISMALFLICYINIKLHNIND